MIRKLPCMTLLLLAATVSIAGTPRVSHITNPAGGFSTKVLIENSGPVDTHFTLNPYDADGHALTAYEGALSAGATMESDVATLFTEGASVASFTISGDAVNVSVAYDFQAGNGSPAHVPVSDAAASSWRIFPGKWDLVFDGLAIVNAGSQPADVWIVQKDFHNTILKAVQVSTALAPNAKALYVVGSPDGSAFDSSVESFYEVSSTSLLSVTALRGTLGRSDSGLLWANDAKPLSDSFANKDEFGVWHIENGNLYELYKMHGYTTAVDRFWQLELNRLRGLGRIAELGGPGINNSAVIFDYRVRASGYSEAQLETLWAGLSDENKALWTGYVDGINQRISEIRATYDPNDLDDVNSADNLLPMELKSINWVNLENYTVFDIMRYFSLIQRFSTIRALGTEQIINGAMYQELIERHGAETAAIMFEDMRWTNDNDSFTMIPPDEDIIAMDPQTGALLSHAEVTAKTAKHRKTIGKLKAGAPDLRDTARRVLAENEAIEEMLTNWGMMKGGSYAWVVSGALTDTGNPMLYAGPQIGFNVPMPSYEASFKTDDVQVAGMALPGVPGVIVGRTPTHSWSMQVGNGSVWDYYVESADTVTLDRIETIQVRGGFPVEAHFYTTENHGPILIRDGFGEITEGETLLAWKYAYRDREFNLSEGIHALARAKDMDEFGMALTNIALSQHFCYADKGGNIAYWMSQRNPVRGEGEWRIPQGLLEDRPVLEWDADVIDPIPHNRNPARGWYGGWNSKPAKDFHIENATHSLGIYQRGHVIPEWFEGKANITFDQVKDLALEISVTGDIGGGGAAWTFVEDIFTAAVQADPTPEREAALAVMTSWDRKRPAGGDRDAWISSDKVQDGAILGDAWIRNTMTKVFDEVMNEDGSTLLGGFGLSEIVFMCSFMREYSDSPAVSNQYNWFASTSAEGPQTVEDMITASLDEVLANLGPLPLNRDRNPICYLHPIFQANPCFAGTTPGAHRASYAHAVEYDKTTGGLVHNQSMNGLGNSGVILGFWDPIDTTQTDPRFDEHFDSYLENFNNWIMRDFPAFD